jgi:tetratricopeptide (TPR) repeat protein
VGLTAIYLGHTTWSELLGNRHAIATFERALAEGASHDQSTSVTANALRIELDERDHQLAIEAGLGAMLAFTEPLTAARRTFEIPLTHFAGGLDRLNADFHPLLGDCMWKAEMREAALVNSLREIRLAEFEREARAYRQRAETAYLNGWYDEALNDYLEAEKRNYPDFAVLRSIASISLYHRPDLPRAFDYFTKAARYARACDVRQAAEAHYFAAMIRAIERRFDAARSLLAEAAALNPRLGEAQYQRACLAALASDASGAAQALEAAIKIDARYFERAKNEAAFDNVRAEVRLLLAQFMEPVAEQIAVVKRDTELLKRYVVVKPDRQQITSMFESVEAQLESATSYRAGMQLVEHLAEMQQELRGIYDLFYKQYEMDARDYARSIAISPDGRWLATGFLYEGIRIWEVDTGLPLQTLKGHVASINSIAFSPDSLLLASASRDRSIKLWDAQSGAEVRELRGHDGEVSAVTFSPDGQWLASASSDRTVRIWRVVTGREVEVMTGHTRAVTAAVFSPDGRWIASGGIDKTIKLWDAATGQIAQTFLGHTEGVAALAFSPDGRWLASGGEDHLAKIWEVETGREVRSLAGHVNDVTSIAFSPDGELVAGGSLGQTVRIWRWQTGRVVKTLWFREISWHPVAFSPRGQWLALASRDVQLWLKAILTEEQYIEVKAGEARSLAQRREMEEMSRELAEFKRIERDEATREMLRLQRRAAGECEVCGARLELVRRLTRRPRCKAHRLFPALRQLPS